jgi:uncharacterized PurR-regulated membrane protein YhhQ (DUF165 family)
MAPSGVLMIGLALVLRDAVHELGGIKAAMFAIALGGVLSAFLAPSALVIASVTAFVLAELADLAVYAPLRKKRLALAVLLSGVAGSVVDSALFLFLAFGSLDFLSGQIVGKLWASIAAFAFLAMYRKRMIFN